MQNDFDQDLFSYFTDVEHLRDAFKAAVAAPELTKRLWVIHGVGGVGKSSLLHMFRLYCKSVKVPIALSSGDEAKSVLDVLYLKSPSGEEGGWSSDLKSAGIPLPKFTKTLRRYRAIQAKVEDEASKITEQAIKGVAKTVIETAASTIPGVGPLVGKLGGVGADALAGWLSKFLTKSDIDLIIDPAKKLTGDFLIDVKKAAAKQRIVLMLDTYEQMTALHYWAGDIAKRLHPNILFVIAGRGLPDWVSDLRANVAEEELTPMSEEVMRELVHRYYAATQSRQPGPKQVEDIVRFARGLPIAVTSVIQLWIKYPGNVGDLKAIKPEVISDLVDLLVEGVPKEMIPALEAVATVRWFDQPILRAVLKQDDVRDVYNEIRRFPFVRPRAEGHALHDAVREIINENLRVQDAERHCELHSRAASYFEKKIEGATSEEAERLGLERLYHRFRANEKEGIAIFQQIAEELGEYRFVNRLRILINDVNTYPLESLDARLWVDYYMAFLLDLEGRWFPAEELFSKIAQNPNASNRVRSYAFAHWGTYLARPERISKPGGIEKAIECLQLGADLSGGYDPSTIFIAWELGLLHQRLCQWDKTWQYMDEIKQYASSLGKSFQAAILKSRLLDPYAKTGNWRGLLDMHEELINTLHGLPVSPETKANLLCNWAVGFCWMGRYAEAEQVVKDAIKPSLKIDLDASGFRRDLGVSLAYQDRFDEANQAFQAGYNESKEWVARRANFDLERATLLHYSFWGMALLRTGELREAKRKLMLAVWLKRKHKDLIGFPELFTSLGTIFELQGDYLSAQKWYLRCVDLRRTARNNFICGALAGLVRVKHNLGDYSSIPPLLAEAEQLAQQYEYNDHLASLRLTQGHIAWDGYIPEWGNGFDAALQYYRHALAYALRYNRFLLDELLSGRPQGTPLRPIIPHCLERGEEGLKMLTALRDWWQTGANDIGMPRPNTISPIHEGIPLLEAERIARQREPGDGSPQKSMIEKIDAALPAQ